MGTLAARAPHAEPAVDVCTFFSNSFHCGTPPALGLTKNLFDHLATILDL